MIAIQPKTRQLLGVNQQAYQALKSSMSLNLRRQLLIAVCDDVRMQNQLASQLETDLAENLDPTLPASAYSSVLNATGAGAEETEAESAANTLRLERLIFDPEDGNLPQQVAQWVRQTMLSERTLPKVQVLGIEQMIHQPAITQNYFLRSLEKIEALLPRLNTSLLVWVPWPWLRTIQQSSPTFWNWRNGVFEFVSEPTPTPDSPSGPADNAKAVHLEFPLFEEAPKQPPTRHELEESHQNGKAANEASGQTDNQITTNEITTNGTATNRATEQANSAAAEPIVEKIDVQPAADKGEIREKARPTTADVAQAQAVARALIEGRGRTARPMKTVRQPIRQAVPISHSLPTQAADQSPPEQTTSTEQTVSASQSTTSRLAASSGVTAQSTVSTDRIISSKRVISLGGLSSVVSRVVDVSDRVEISEGDNLAALDAMAQDSTVGAREESGPESTPEDALEEAPESTPEEAPESMPENAAALTNEPLADNMLDNAPATEDLVADALIENDAAASAIAEREFASLDWDDFIDSSDSTTLPDVDEPFANELATDEIAVAELADATTTTIIEADLADADTDVLAIAERELKSATSAEATSPANAAADDNIFAILERETLAQASEAQASSDSTGTVEADIAEAEQRNRAADFFSLGLSYRSQIEAGERSLDVIEPAIAAYQSGLDLMVIPHADWVTGLNDLGTLYWLKAQQQNQPVEAIAAMQQSIRLYREALDKSQSGEPGYEDLQPGIVGQLYSNMGAVYTVLATYDQPQKYLKKAAETYANVLFLLSLQSEPIEYATLQNSLGSVYWKLSHYEAAPANLHRAIGAYNEALLGYKPEQKPLEYAAVQNNLGITYWSLAKHERAEFLLKHAIAAYRDALNYRTSEVDPAGCAISYNNLALAYWDLSKQTQSDIAQKSRYQKNAVTAFEAALNISKISGALNMMDSAAIYHCLGDVHAQMIETAPSKADIAESLQKSLYSYLQSIEGLSNDDPAYPGRFAAIVANLKLHYDKIGLEGQQSALNRIPPTVLPQVMMAL